MAFLVLGPCFGVLSDKFDRRRTIITVLVVEACSTGLIAILLVADLMHPYLMFPFMMVSSACQVLDTTNRPAMVYDHLFAAEAETLIAIAMALRSVGRSIGDIFGNQLSGYIVGLAGVAGAFLLVVSLLLGTAALLSCVPSPPKASRGTRQKVTIGSPCAVAARALGARHGMVEQGTEVEAVAEPDDDKGLESTRLAFKASVAAGRAAERDNALAGSEKKGGLTQELAAGVAMAWRDRTFMGMLGVTFLGNFFYFSHRPILQVLATRLGVTPYETGLFVSAGGWGTLLAAVQCTLQTPQRSGMLYCLGIAFATLILIGAASLSFWAAFAALLLSGYSVGLFGAIQSAMVMSMVPDELRGRALGLLTLAIGAMPLGMMTLGELAEVFGAAAGLRGFAFVGFVMQMLWLWLRPEALYIRRTT